MGVPALQFIHSSYDRRRFQARDILGGHRPLLQLVRSGFMRNILRLTITILLASSSFAQTKRPMTVDDLITAIRVSEPRVSPDGKQVVFTRTATALDSGRSNADIWTVPGEGSAPAK